MSAPKWTPGPWEVGARSSEDNTLAVVRSGRKGRALAYVCPQPFYENAQEVDAHLIASAPDLAEALCSCWDSLSEIVEDSEGCGGQDGARLRANALVSIDQARAALTRARGEGVS